MTLRDTSIRETSLPLTTTKEASNGGNSNASASSYFRGSMYNNSGINVTTQQLPTTLIGARESFSLAPDQFGGYGGGSGQQQQQQQHYGAVLRDTGNLPPPSRLASNRLLAAGLDQRILKQSTEDCRRLLQQVSFKLTSKLNLMYLNR